jgi:hypothetical protein
MDHLLVASNPFVIAAVRSGGRRIVRWIVLLVVVAAACYTAVRISRRRHDTSQDADARADEWPRRPTS